MKYLVGLEWTNKNSQRNYPFTDSSTMIVGDYGFIPNDLIVDARIYLRGTYKALTTPHVGQISLELDKAIFHIMLGESELGQVEIPWNIAANIQYTPVADTKLASFSIFNAGIPTGMMVINVTMLHILQSLGQGSYTLGSEVLQFLPFVCEYLPGPQITSVNGLTGPVTLRGETGIQVKQLPSSDNEIEISIVGDPHFTRYNCLPGASDIADALINLRSNFLEELVIVHYLNANSSNPSISKLKTRIDSGPRQDGSIDFHSESPPLQNGRRAFRITVNGNTINFSMAGGNV